MIYTITKLHEEIDPEETLSKHIKRELDIIYQSTYEAISFFLAKTSPKDEDLKALFNELVEQKYYINIIFTLVSILSVDQPEKHIVEKHLDATLELWFQSMECALSENKQVNTNRIASKPKNYSYAEEPNGVSEEPPKKSNIEDTSSGKSCDPTDDISSTCTISDLWRQTKPSKAAAPKQSRIPILSKRRTI